jgi:hypothetical protein
MADEPDKRNEYPWNPMFLYVCILGYDRATIMSFQNNSFDYLHVGSHLRPSEFRMPQLQQMTLFDLYRNAQALQFLLSPPVMSNKMLTQKEPATGFHMQNLIVPFPVEIGIDYIWPDMSGRAVNRYPFP